MFGENNEPAAPNDDQVKAWILAMFKALGLGDPVFSTTLLDDGGGQKEDQLEGSKDEDDPLAEARSELAARLDAIVLPARLPSEEAIRVEGQVAIVRTVLVASKSAADLAKVETAIVKLETIAESLRAAMERRLARSLQLSTALAGLTAPDIAYLAASEAPDLLGEGAAIARDLSGPIGETTLSVAEGAIRALAGRVNIAKVLANGRAARSAIVLASFGQIVRPEGGAQPDYIAYDAEIPAISALETPPVGDREIATAEAALTRLKAEAGRLAAFFAARAQRVEKASGNLAAIDFKGIDAEAGLGDLEKEKGEIAIALPLARDDGAIGALEARITALAKAATDALGNRAAKVLAAIPSLQVPVDLPQPEAKPFTGRIEAIRAAATPPIAADALLIAVDDLDKLPGELLSAAERVADRRKRIDKAADDVSKLANDPPGANVAEKAELKVLRDSPALQPPASLTEDAALAATLAAKALSDRHAQLVIEIKAREDKRAEVLKTLLTLVPPISATGAETLTVLKDGAVLRAAVEKADTLSDIEAEDAGVKALQKAVKDIETLVAARAKAVNTMAVAEELVKSERKNLFAGGYSKLIEMLSNAGLALDAAKTVKDYEAAETKIADIALYLAKIKDYRAALNTWRVEAEFHINMMQTKSTLATPPARTAEEKVLLAKKAAMQKLLLSLSKSADALATQGKITDAKAELAKFKTQAASYTDPNDSSVKSVSYVAVADPAAVAFPGIVATFMKGKYPIIEMAERHKEVIEVEKLKASWGNSRSKGFTEQKWALATSEIATLSSDLDKCKTFIDAYREYEALLKAAPDPSPLFTALGQIKGDCVAKNFGAAKLKVDALDTGTQKNDAAYLKKRNGLKGRVAAALSVLTGAAGNGVSVPWAGADTEPDHGKRMARLDDVLAALGPCETLIAEKDKAKARLGTLDPGKYKILEAADTLVTAGDIPGATAAYKQAEVEAGKLAEYLGLLERVKTVRASYPATAAEAIKRADDAMLDADAKATTQQLGQARDALLAVLNEPDVVVIDKAAALYQSRRKATKTMHDKVLASITYPAAKLKLTAPWAVIETAGEVDRKYLEAVDLMDTHKGVLAEAKPYVDARLRATRALIALDKIANKVPAPQKLLVYALPIDKNKLDTDLAAAEVKAAAGDFAGASKAFDDLVTLAKDRMKLAATSLEDMDHGHFLEGHGPDVPVEGTLERMTTGWRPDGEYAPAIKSSQFLDIGDFMASYDLAWEEAKAQKPSFFGGTTIKATDPAQVALKMDAGKAIGMGVEGLTKQVGFAKGVEGDTDLYDTFEVTQGLDQLQFKFMFHFAHPDGSDTVITTHKAYDAAYKTANSTTVVPPNHDYPGHWALNQLLPSTG